MRHTPILVRAATLAVLGLALAAPAVVTATSPAAAMMEPAVQETPGPPPLPDPSEPVPPSEAPPGASPAPSGPRESAEPAAPAEERGGGRGLPVTGAQVGGMVVLGGGLIAAGIAMVAVRRRGLSDFDLADS